MRILRICPLRGNTGTRSLTQSETLLVHGPIANTTFDALTFSDEVRISKPGKDIFLQACAALGVPLNQIVHVGDSLRNDAFGARQVGMKAIWIETQDERTTPPDVEPDVELDLGPDATVKSLSEVADAIGRIVAATP